MARHVMGVNVGLLAVAGTHSLAAMNDTDASADEGWRKEGTCGACVYFRTDFGDAPVFYGNCKMYTRTGSRGSSDYSCPEFKPLPGFDKKISLTDQAPSTGATRTGRGRSLRSGLPSRHRRQRSLPQGPRIVRRRTGDDGGAIQTESQLVSDEVMAALTGAEGGEETMDRGALRDVLLDIVENFIAIEECEIGSKWEGGVMSLQPADPDLKSHDIPIETFFHKVVMLRDRLRVMEQKINANKALTPSDKVQLQQYISGCYGSLTSFNVLFKHKEDKFSSK